MSDTLTTIKRVQLKDEEFVEVIRFDKFAVYIFAYGSPVTFRLALNHPEIITAIVSQNGNAYEEGVDERFWAPISKWWKKNDPKDPESVITLTKVLENPRESIESQYYLGVKNPDIIDPAPIAPDGFLTTKPGQLELQLGLFFDYSTDLKLYPQFQKYSKDSGVPVLLTLGVKMILFLILMVQKDIKKMLKI